MEFTEPNVLTENAAVVFTFGVHGDLYDTTSHPKDFAFAGAGSFRTCYVKDGWVYKFDRNTFSHENENLREYDSYQHLLTLTLPDHVQLPTTHLVHTECQCADTGCHETGCIIVMEHIVGDHPPHSIYNEHDPQYPLYRSMFDALGLFDLMGTNLIINEAGWWPIDMQH